LQKAYTSFPLQDGIGVISGINQDFPQSAPRVRMRPKKFPHAFFKIFFSIILAQTFYVQKRRFHTSTTYTHRATPLGKHDFLACLGNPGFRVFKLKNLIFQVTGIVANCSGFPNHSKKAYLEKSLVLSSENTNLAPPQFS
jgi:hypothetical protein